MYVCACCLSYKSISYMYERNDDFMSFRHWIVGKGKHLHMAYGLISALIQHPTGEDGKWLAAMKVKESLPHTDFGWLGHFYKHRTLVIDSYQDALFPSTILWPDFWLFIFIYVSYIYIFMYPILFQIPSLMFFCLQRAVLVEYCSLLSVLVRKCWTRINNQLSLISFMKWVPFQFQSDVSF